MASEKDNLAAASVIGDCLQQRAGTGDAETPVEIERIVVSGTRLPAASLVTLSSISPHDKINGLGVNAACHKITATGLIKNR